MTSALRKRVLSGMRPTGRLHIGNYFGALANWVKLQADPSNECFFFVADWHSLTTDYADTLEIAQNTIEVTTDFLAGGLDAKKSTIFLQSSVPEHAELHLLLSMITPLGWLERVPTYKEQLENVKDKDLHTYGFLGYPVLQTGDIVMYGEPGRELIVPVGDDQVAHVELSREIVRRFNTAYSKPDWSHAPQDAARELSRSLDLMSRKSVGIPLRTGDDDPLLTAMRSSGLRSKDPKEMLEAQLRVLSLEERHSRLANARVPLLTVLREPEVMLTQSPRIPGTDGRKMSKSYGNAITLSESDESIRAKTKVMMTDPARKRRQDPGNPDVCPVYDWHKLFSPPETLQWANDGCRTAGIGCIECKSTMADNLIRWITPVRERRLEFERKPRLVKEILRDGSTTARRIARKTMLRVRDAIFGEYRIKRARGRIAIPKRTRSHGR
jgi:tryptophanyl-tRNA synthetase